MIVLVTGANGFVGRALVPVLRDVGHEVVSVVRTQSSKSQIVVDVVGEKTRWVPLLRGVDVIVHLVGRTHEVRGKFDDRYAQYDEVNVRGTRRLAVEAAHAGVKRLVYVSSIKVNGERTTGNAFTEDDIPHPEDDYGFSKWHAEQALWEVSQETGLEVVVVRPPLVYGPGVKANFLRLLKAVARRWPLPFGAIRNQRSLVGVRNLCDLLRTSVDAPAASGQIFLVSDGTDVSTVGLIQLLAAALKVRARLLDIPEKLLYICAMLLGKRSELEKICGSLCVDPGKARAILGWTPPYTMAEEIEVTVAWYRSELGGAKTAKQSALGS